MKYSRIYDFFSSNADIFEFMVLQQDQIDVLKAAGRKQFRYKHFVLGEVFVILPILQILKFQLRVGEY